MCLWQEALFETLAPEADRGRLFPRFSKRGPAVTPCKSPEVFKTKKETLLHASPFCLEYGGNQRKMKWRNDAVKYPPT